MMAYGEPPPGHNAPGPPRPTPPGYTPPREREGNENSTDRSVDPQDASETEEDSSPPHQADKPETGASEEITELWAALGGESE